MLKSSRWNINLITRKKCEFTIFDTGTDITRQRTKHKKLLLGRKLFSLDYLILSSWYSRLNVSGIGAITIVHDLTVLQYNDSVSKIVIFVIMADDQNHLATLP